MKTKLYLSVAEMIRKYFVMACCSGQSVFHFIATGVTESLHGLKPERDLDRTKELVMEICRSMTGKGSLNPLGEIRDCVMEQLDDVGLEESKNLKNMAECLEWSREQAEMYDEAAQSCQRAIERLERAERNAQTAKKRQEAERSIRVAKQRLNACLRREFWVLQIFAQMAIMFQVMGIVA